MARVKRAVNAHKKRRVVLERASGYRGQRSRLYRKAKEQLLHSFTYNYRDRKARKGDFRKLWIQRINAAVRAEGITYNRFIQGLRLESGQALHILLTVVIFVLIVEDHASRDLRCSHLISSFDPGQAMIHRSPAKAPGLSTTRSPVSRSQ